MGNATSAAEVEVEEAQEEITQMLQILENKRDEFLARVKLTRGEGSESSKEIQGGRTVTRTSDIRVATNTGVDSQLSDALNTFFETVQGGDKAKKAAVVGAQKLLSVGLNAIFGARAGSGKEKIGFVVLFVNFAFVRVDYLVYAYTASGAKWGAEANKSGACYVADLAVLPLNSLESQEIDYLLAQSLTITAGEAGSDKEFVAIQKLKIQLVESKVLSNLLEKGDLKLEDLADYAEALVRTEAAIREAFDSLEDFGGGNFESGNAQPGTAPALPTTPAT